MPSTYSPSLRLELIADNEQAGIWGQTTNRNFVQVFEESIVGVTEVNVTAGNVTLTASNGLSDESRRPYIVVTGTPVAARTVTAADVNKLYFVQNQTGQAVTIRGGAQTGVTVNAGAFAYVRLRAGLPAQAVQLIAADGAASVSTLSVAGAATLNGNLTVQGVTTLNGNMVFGNAGSDTVAFASSNITWSGNPTHSGNHTFSGNVGVVGAATFIGNVTIGDAPADTLNINPSAVGWPNNPTHSGNHTFSGNLTAQGVTTLNGNLTVQGVTTLNGNMVFGDAGSDTVAFASSNITWSGNPTHTGNHTFSGNLTVQGVTTLNGNMVFGNAGSDTVAFASSNITWSGNPLHSGDHMFSGTVTHRGRLDVTSSVNLSPLAIFANSGSNGAQIQLSGNGSNPQKTIRVLGGNFEIINNAYTAAILSLTDAGVLTAPSFSGNGSGLTTLNASNLASGTVPDARLPGTISSNTTGNAATASALATARTISLTGNVSGSASFDGTANVSITATVAANSHAHTIANVTGLQGALDARAQFYTGTDSTLLSYPIGQLLLVDQDSAATPARNDAATVYRRNDQSDIFTLSATEGGTNTALSGTWRARGAANGRAEYLMQRVA